MAFDWPLGVACVLFASPFLYGVVDLLRDRSSERRPRYPVLHKRRLRPPIRYSALRQRRRPLRAAPGQTLVYRTDDGYVADAVNRPAVRVLEVAVVDVRRDVTISVRDQVEASDSLDFPVWVTYHCTVVDPVAVVRDRTGDIHDFLRGGLDLRSHKRAYVSGDEAGLRRAITAQLERSPLHDTIPGLRIVLHDVRVDAAFMEEA